MAFPKNKPSAPAAFTALLAKIPVISIPTIPPIPWHGNTSNVSSTLDFVRIETARFDIIAATNPMKALCAMPTKPLPGVMATNPTTAPIQKPSTEGFFPRITSKNIHDKPAVAAAILVVAKADTANVLAPNADPALKPNQPNQSKPVPINT